MKRLVILGGGESGVGTAILAAKQGYEVFLSDKGELKPDYKAELEKRGFAYEERQHTEALIYNADEVVKSPGIPEKSPIIENLRAKGIPVISEIEFASRYTDAKKICITGSNGKTTTTMLTYFILKNEGLNVGLAGNVGKSFAWQVAECNYDYYVLELSSFQLDGMYDFKADVSVILNITPDHLDRYDYKFQNYIDSKFRILQNQTPEDAFIFWNDDPVLKAEIEKRNIKAQLLPFALEKKTLISFSDIAVTPDDANKIACIKYSESVYDKYKNSNILSENVRITSKNSRAVITGEYRTIDFIGESKPIIMENTEN